MTTLPNTEISNMEAYIKDIILILVASGGVISTRLAWVYGGRQKAKNQDDETEANGAEKVVKTAMELLDRINGLLDIESKHRRTCEEELAEVKGRVLELEKLVKKEG